ncbi:MAG: oligosaccharide biosynthesis protein Alg14 [Enterococcus lacertideformus]|uniref:Oligosaccharide biosynthesis protein Alg14 n=1 Tax=Enterococcus lacertideformus TaxID=2771493 RepID=A0A931ATJ7_9ENTE|nr:oligosaccharide biosynthesis protein Alg14 [Enterococcus lacertideformus]
MTKLPILLVAKDKSLYFFPSINSLDVISGKDLLDPVFFTFYHPKLKEYELIIFLDYGFKMAMATRIRPYTKAKMVLFFWNHFKEEHYRLLEQAKNDPVIDEVYHFDYLEAKELGLLHNSSFYSKNMEIPKAAITSDLFFGATDNGRKEQAECYKKEFEQRGLKTNYFILPLRGNEQANYLSYTEYLELTARSRGILELLRAGQRGVTLRSFESIYFEKKLVTGNEAIMSYQFYHPDNVFLLQERALDELPGFLHSSFQSVDTKILDFFDASNWAKRFLGMDKEIFETYEYLEGGKD